jgi:hypothetical protein
MKRNLDRQNTSDQITMQTHSGSAMRDELLKQVLSPNSSLHFVVSYPSVYTVGPHMEPRFKSLSQRAGWWGEPEIF